MRNRYFKYSKFDLNFKDWAYFSGVDEINYYFCDSYSLSDCDYVFVIQFVTIRNVLLSVIMENKYTVCTGCPKKGDKSSSHNSWSIIDITNEHIPERILIWVFKIDFTSFVSDVVAELFCSGYVVVKMIKLLAINLLL